MDTIICGMPTAVAPDGTTVRRPFYKVVTVCEDGCTCDDDALAARVRYEACADECVYTYTMQPCQTSLTILTQARAGCAFQHAQRDAQ